MKVVADFDYSKIKDMEYDKDRDRYIAPDGSEFSVKPYSDGSGFKIDYYESSTYGNSRHNSTHIKADVDGSWDRTDNDRDSGTQEHSSGSGCYLTTACMRYLQDKFDDNCYELTVLRWFRDNYVLEEDIKHYYEVAPLIVEAIDNEEQSDIIYNYIYDNVVDYCVTQIENGNYNAAYLRYKNTILNLEEKFTGSYLVNRLVKKL